MGSLDHVLTGMDFFERFGFAVLLGSIIGFEREWRRSTAGVHTMALVCGGTSLFAMITPLIVAPSVGDPSRIIGQVVTGIGFLAGGVILRQGSDVSGLNTAATMWATAAVGGLAAFGFYPQATAGAVAITIVNFVSPYVRQFVRRHSRFVPDADTEYQCEIVCRQAASDAARDAILAAVSASRLRLVRISSEQTDAGQVTIVATLSLMGRKNDEVVKEFSTSLEHVSGITAVNWKTAASAN